MKKKKEYNWLVEFEALCRGNTASFEETERAIKQVEKKRTKQIMHQP
ncbi:MAG: hypothetical protein NTX79_03220 [Candidatus Micrarchaeota archaeon]|nr:hypothetical protein [Candidatus Micrarchaeota archaeon]